MRTRRRRLAGSGTAAAATWLAQRGPYSITIQASGTSPRGWWKSRLQNVCSSSSENRNFHSNARTASEDVSGSKPGYHSSATKSSTGKTLAISCVPLARPDTLVDRIGDPMGFPTRVNRLSARVSGGGRPNGVSSLEHRRLAPGAPHLAQGVAHLTHGHVGPGGVDDRGHEVHVRGGGLLSEPESTVQRGRGLPAGVRPPLPAWGPAPPPRRAGAPPRPAAAR